MERYNNWRHSDTLISAPVRSGVEAVEKGQEVFLTLNWLINELKITPILKIWRTQHRKRT